MSTMQRVSGLVSKDIANYITNQQTWGGILYNVKAYGAKGDGSTNDTAAIQAAIDAAIAQGVQDIYFPPGNYVASGLTNTEQVNFVGDGAKFVGTTYAIFNDGMQLKKARLGKGQQSGNIFISTEGTHKEIADIDSVALHVVSGSRTDFANGSVEFPRVWGINTIVAKHEHFTNSYVVGLEVSMVNNTTNTAGVIGVLSSYVGQANGARAAFESTGNIAGWTNGLMIDAVKPTGTGIRLDDSIPAVFGGAAGGGMSVGIDLSPVTAFTNGAILLGNGHSISSRDDVGGITSILFTNAALTGLRVAGTSGNLVIQDKTGVTNYLRAGVDATNSIEIRVNGALKRVEVGSTDSGGVGYRMLRVAN